jgi:UV DNA damage endonuclease
MRTAKRKGKDGKTREALLAPVWTGHADFVQPFEFIGFMRAMAGLTFDVMLEAKAKDLALIRLRLDLVRYAPDVAARFGLTQAAEAGLAAEEQALMETEEA